MLPEPALSFTIPSLHDGTSLDCRVYHPASLAATNTKAPPWKKHAAVVAHPYAPMGGSYDDAILESIAARLLSAGYLVGTFNFRGAGHSAGRTSWTAKPERDDYASIVGFVAHYVHFLNPFSTIPLTAEVETTTTTTTTLSSSETIEPPVLLMAGYSYGAMVTTQLPPIEDILSPFAAPDTDSNASQIRLRAQHLAEQQNLILGSTRAAMLQVKNPHSPRKRSSGVRIGGDEGDRSPRKSHDSHGRRSFSSPGRRSFSLDAEDRVRRGVYEFMAKRKAKHGVHHFNWTQRRSMSGSEPQDAGPSLRHQTPEASESPKQPVDATDETELERLPAMANFVYPRPAYILVSPLQGLVMHLATMSLYPSRHKTREADAAENKLVETPTLAVFGDHDVFVPVGKLRTWTRKLSSRDESRFTGHEIPRAGHFWAEEGVLHGMNERVGAFAGGLIQNE